jgi:hypothetical protein
VAKELRATRYLPLADPHFAAYIQTDLRYLDFHATLDFYNDVDLYASDADKALLNANDRYYLLTTTCKRYDAMHPWLFERCREVEKSPDGHLDLWARYHYKSTICTFAGCLQEIIVDPEITIAIISGTNKVAQPFLIQLQEEMERNEDLKRIHADVFWEEPRKQAPQWSRDKGLVVKRKSNPKESTIEAFGLIDGMRTGKHYKLLNYDDLVDETMVNNPDTITKVTTAWELSDNLGQLSGTRKWHQGTRYSFADTYGILIERKALKERRYPATVDGTLKGEPIMLSPERWSEIKNAQRSTVNAQMLLNPIAGNTQTFDPTRFKHYDVIPSVMNVYILVDPSKGKSKRSDNSAIAVVGIDVGGNKYLLDGHCHRMKLSRRWELIKQLKKKWEDHPGVQMVRVGYEQYGMQTDIEVLEEKMEAEGNHFLIEELNTPREGSHSKNDRISRLEPEFNRGAFYMPAVVYHPEYGGGIGFQALWDVWSFAKAKLMEDAGINDPNQNPPVGTIVYRPMQGLTNKQRYCEATHQTYRVVTALKRKNEDGDMYDLTRVLIEELRFHPFAPHDDLVDSVSRIYDMEPKKPVMFEAANAEMRAHPDS